MSADSNPFHIKYILNPIYWPTWFGFALLWLVIHLPLRAIHIIGAIFGWISMYLMHERRRISRANIRLCFPDLSKREQKRLLRQSFYSAGQALFESALTWWGSEKRMQRLLHIEGLEHLEQAQQHGRGVILLGGHYTTMEICGRIAAMHIPEFFATYKKARNSLFEAMMTRARHRLKAGTILSLNMREIIRQLKLNKVVWYAPDQDFGEYTSVFAPFMGVQTATLTLTSRLAKRSNSIVLPWHGERLPNAKGYKFVIGAPLENYPSDDMIADATVYNASLEKQVRARPEQYLWGHRRFKTRPPGVPHVYPPRRDSRLRRYSRLLFILSLPYIFYTLLLAYRNRDKRYLKQRLGIYPEDAIKTDFWFHAASVGEVVALLPLIEKLQASYPDKKIVLSTFTPTGGAIAVQRLPDGVDHVYLPIDWVFAVKKFLKYINPRCGIIMETELWPNLFEYCRNYSIPNIIINGRLSAKSLNRKGWIRTLISRSIDYTKWVLAKNELEKEHFKQLNAKDDKIFVLGNLKYAAVSHQISEPIELGRPYILVASTHNDEEVQIARQWQACGDVNHLLVIAPRHPHRRDKIIKAFEKRAITCAVRSRDDNVDEFTEIYLADTFGELNQFIAGASFVIMGGSFAPIGGHNILEVAAQNKAVIFGPYMHNFVDERLRFLQANAAIEVNDYEELMLNVRKLLDNPELNAQMGDNASALLQEHTEILDNYLSHLDRFFKTFGVLK